jgi:hypothetical protein
VVASPFHIARVARPKAFPWGSIREVKGSARHVWTSITTAGFGHHLVKFGLPPRPHFAIDSISFGPIEEEAGHTDDSSCAVTKISLSSGPSIRVFDDEVMVS